MMQGQVIQRQTANTLKSMQALARVQTQVRERRLKMAEENLAHQKQIQQKYAKEQAMELEKSQVGKSFTLIFTYLRRCNIIYIFWFTMCQEISESCDNDSRLT